MLNRRGFVQSLGIGTVGAFTLARREVSLDAFAGQNGAGRQPMGPGTIRIGSNENPYGPVPAAVEAARAAVADGHRYAGAIAGKLSEALTTMHGVPPTRLLLSGGSGDLLRAAIRAFTAKDRALVTGSPSYEQPVRQAKQAEIPVHEIPLTPTLELDLGQMLAKASGAGMVYICNPNNPTSTIVPSSQVKDVVEKVAAASPSTTVLVDEAYFEYVDDPSFGTLIPLVATYPNLVVVRTFSKIHGMAGMRVGYAIAQEKAVAALREHHSSSGISVMSFAAAAASLADKTAMARNQQLNREVRAFTMNAFKKAGYTVAASQANFLMVDVRRDSRAFGDACRQKGVAIGRPFPPLSTWARITVGTQDEMTRAMPVFMDLLNAAPTVALPAAVDELEMSTC
jgi:histidinol-phosphate aminotransferase